MPQALPSTSFFRSRQVAVWGSVFNVASHSHDSVTQSNCSEQRLTMQHAVRATFTMTVIPLHQCWGCVPPSDRWLADGAMCEDNAVAYFRLLSRKLVGCEPETSWSMSDALWQDDSSEQAVEVYKTWRHNELLTGRVHRSLPLDYVLSHMHPIHTLTPYLTSTLILFFHPFIGIANGLFPAILKLKCEQL